MTSLLVSAVAGVVFGVALAAPPGPMNAIIAEESVLRGWHAGFWAGVGAMLADVLFFALTFAGVAALLGGNRTVQHVLFLVGGALMLFFALGAARDARAASSFTDGEVDRSATGFQKAFALSLTNPYQLAFWLTVGVGLVRPGTLSLTAHLPAGTGTLVRERVGELAVQTGSPALLVGFFGGIALWIVCYPAALVGAGRRVDALAPLVAALSAAVLCGFGLLFAWIGVTGLL
ncbi:LysE family translocator [Natrononativus amylolyticus]|uniref:LysE family translocator n=1 Tax=Natrononativus amylolyticus TaxID=2963434 RepID=UPI0020CC35C0|nr:LysE family transporter [Natrononativus amylolyticus]